MAILEVAVFSPKAAQMAQNAGANRLEICCNYKAGGLTPTQVELEEIASFANIPVLAMIRPREGNFIYSLSEIWEMLVAIEKCKSLGFNGIVFGILNNKNEIDIGALKEIMAASEGMETTFHRAFDHTNDPIHTMDILIDKGVTRILSAAWKEKDISVALDFKKHADNHIIYMPGGGVRSTNIQTLIDSGFTEIHTAAILGNDAMPDNSEITKMQRSMHA